MPRIICLIAVFLVGLGIAAWLAKRANNSSDSRSSRTFRPKQRAKPFKPPFSDEVNAPFVMNRTAVQGVCDAFTGAHVDVSKKIWRCMGCQSMYHDESRKAVQKELGRGCMNCESSDQRLVRFD